jgi:nicotinamidase-related amidase
VSSRSTARRFEEQRCRPCQGCQDLQHPDHDHHCRNRLFSGNTFPELLAVVPDNDILERTSMNSWDDQNVRDALAKNAADGRKKIVVAGLWTEVCNTTFALSALHDVPDYEIYMVADASGGTSLMRTNTRWTVWFRLASFPVTWQQVLLEWQRDWARKETYDAVTTLVKEHSGAYGMGIDYAVTHVHGGEERVKHGKRIGPNPPSKSGQTAPITRRSGLSVIVRTTHENLSSVSRRRSAGRHRLQPPERPLAGSACHRSRWASRHSCRRADRPLQKACGAGEPAALSWLHQVKPHMFGHLPKGGECSGGAPSSADPTREERS